MNLDEFQKVWQAQQETGLDAERIAEALRHHDRAFRKTIFWRDVREIGAALVVIPAWIALGVATSSPWTWWLEIPALLWVAGFMFVDRRRQQRKSPGAGASLRVGLEYSVSQVEHQIWLLRNILWWYLLPLGVPLLLFNIHRAVESARESETFVWDMLVDAAVPTIVVAGVFGLIYWLNQYAVRKGLEPLREQLRSALAAIEEPGSS